MEIKGEYKIAAPREKVFAALNDQAVLQACIPGCESLEKTSDTEMKAKVRMRIGPVSASFTRQGDAERHRPAQRLQDLAAKGRAGPRASPRAAPWSTLREDGGDTVLNYNVDAQVGGKIAQVGARLIDGTAKKLADEFFGKFATMVGGPPPAAAVAGTPSDAPPAPDTLSPPSPPSAAAQRGYRHWLVIGVGAAVLILIFLASR